MMNEMIKVEVNDNQEQTVSGRELHAFLEIETRYNDWFGRMLKYGFVEGVDFNLLKSEQVQLEGNREVKREIVDHILKLDMAKELCMLARSDKGKQARHYFLELEREWNSPEKVMARALQIAEIKLKEVKAVCDFQAQQIAEFKPIKEYMDVILASDDTLTASQIAADYGISAKELNKVLHDEKLIRKVNKQWLLYKEEMQKGYTKSETITVERKDGGKKIVMHTMWTQKGRLRIHEILTRLGYKANMDKEIA